MTQTHLIDLSGGTALAADVIQILLFQQTHKSYLIDVNVDSVV